MKYFEAVKPQNLKFFSEHYFTDAETRNENTKKFQTSPYYKFNSSSNQPHRRSYQSKIIFSRNNFNLYDVISKNFSNGNAGNDLVLTEFNTNATSKFLIEKKVVLVTVSTVLQPSVKQY